MSRKANTNIQKLKELEELKKQKRQAGIWALGICLAGLIVTAIILIGVDLYRTYHYTEAIAPEGYKIIKMEESLSGNTSADGGTTDVEIYIVTVQYEVDGKEYSDTLDMLRNTEQSQRIHSAYMSHDHPEEKLGTLYYNPQKPSKIGRVDWAEE